MSSSTERLPMYLRDFRWFEGSPYLIRRKINEFLTIMKIWNLVINEIILESHEQIERNLVLLRLWCATSVCDITCQGPTLFDLTSDIGGNCACTIDKGKFPTNFLRIYSDGSMIILTYRRGDDRMLPPERYKSCNYWQSMNHFIYSIRSTSWWFANKQDDCANTWITISNQPLIMNWIHIRNSK